MSHASSSSSIFAPPRLVALERLQRGDLDDRHVVAGELVGGQQLADLELDEVEQLRVVDHVALVERHDDVGDPDLAGEQHVLTGLGHRAVGGAHDQDRAVHLGGAGDHVLHVVGVAGAVDVGVVAVVGLVLDVGDRDRDAALALLRGLVDLVEGGEVGQTLVGLALRDRRREGGLAVVDVPDRADVHVGLVPLELLLAHHACSLACVPRCRCGGSVRSGGGNRTRDTAIMSRLLYL